MAVIETALTRLLSIEHPILLAPMGSAAGGRLAAAVTNAGGLGMVGSGYANIDAIRRELNPVYFENRSFSSLWSRWYLTQRRSAMVHGSWLMRASNAATRRVRSSAVGWQ